MKLKLQTWLALTVILLAIPTAVRADCRNRLERDRCAGDADGEPHGTI
jgi:hypothetical protein